MSPVDISSTATTCSLPSFIKLAVFGTNPTNLLIAFVVRLFDTPSKYLPSVINVKITAADS